MSPPLDTPLVPDPKSLLLALAQEHSLPDLLRVIVKRLAQTPRVPLARIWLIQPTFDCTGCAMLPECRNRAQCLHLVASAGQSQNPGVGPWTSLEGAFRRFPLGVRKVGRIAALGEPIEVPNLAQSPAEWVARPEWIEAEAITGFAGQPLTHRGVVLGVLAVFSRGPIDEDCMSWLRMIANHAAAAIATARAFAEVESLKKSLELENEYLRDEVTQAGAFGTLVGESPALHAVNRQIELVAPTESTVLVLGESGTGKELVAREIHHRSRRSERPLIKVNCASIPRELFESEFFGHVKGAFTGALRDRAGRFELADGGTLFLDEIGEIPLDLQAKLLRVLQEGELERVGEERTRRVDVRLVAATNRDLRVEADAGRFRQDLYYRLCVFPIDLPPLRKRKSDIPLLAEHFLELFSRKTGRPKPRLTIAATQRLQQYDWPGNVRELQFVLERAMISSSGGRLTIELPLRGTPAAHVPPALSPPDRVLTNAELRQIEAGNLRAALQATGGRIYGAGGAAELLGIKPTTLASRLKALGIRDVGKPIA